LQAEEKRLSEAAFKSMMDEYIAIQEELMKEREEQMGELKKAIAATVIKNTASSDVGQMQQATDPFFKDNVINVFMNRCHKCHGNEEAKGGLRLHTLAATLQGGDGGPSIVQGDAEKSLLVELIKLDEDDDDIMPPKGGKLTDKEIAAIEKWINEGAKW
jgi:mono/diheme cytochrome c family protein